MIKFVDINEGNIVVVTGSASVSKDGDMNFYLKTANRPYLVACVDHRTGEIETFGCNVRILFEETGTVN
jgi:hypothetical protein